SASRKNARRARRGAGSRPHRAAAMASARGPDRRTMPTPPAPGAVAMAAMVSDAVMAVANGTGRPHSPAAQAADKGNPPGGGFPGSLLGGLGRRLAVALHHPPLLQQAQRAVGH